MTSRALPIAAAGAAALFVLTGALSATAASPWTRWVDDDGQAGATGCDASAAAFPTVQAAVIASGPGDTVIVCPGTYEEQVRIRGQRDGLTIRAATPWSATLLTPSVLVRPRGFSYLVLVEQVDDVTIRGLRLRARSSGPCTRADVLVAALASTGTMVRGNRMAAQGDPAGPCGFGLGVAESDSLNPSVEHPVSAGPSSLTAAYNLIEGFRQAGIGAFSSGRRITLTASANSLRFRDGTLDGAQAGVMAFGRVSGRIDNNVVRGASEGKGTQLFAGVYLASQDAADRGPGMTVRANRIQDTETGIGLQRADGSIVSDNILRGTDTAVLLSDVTDALVIRNDATGGSQAAYADADAGDNVLRANVFSGPCADLSSGAGTAGTANTWAGNVGASSTPSGICMEP